MFGFIFILQSRWKIKSVEDCGFWCQQIHTKMKKILDRSSTEISIIQRCNEVQVRNVSQSKQGFHRIDGFCYECLQFAWICGVNYHVELLSRTGHGSAWQFKTKIKAMCADFCAYCTFIIKPIDAAENLTTLLCLYVVCTYAHNMTTAYPFAARIASKKSQSLIGSGSEPSSLEIIEIFTNSLW